MQLFEIRLCAAVVPPQHLAKLSEDAGRPLAYQMTLEGEPFSWLEYSTPSALFTVEQLARWAPLISPEIVAVRTINEPHEPAEGIAAEWWKTYRAALTGLHARPGEDAITPERAHKAATTAANLAHGPLPEKSKS